MKLRLAIVDDEKIVCKNLGKNLQKNGFIVETFQTGASFLKRMEQSPFDLIFLDILLPDMNGMSVLSEIKSKYHHSEIIIMTGFSAIGSAVEAGRKGAFHYIAKPFRLEEIISLANRVKDKIYKRKHPLSGNNLGDNLLDREFIGASRAMQDIFVMIKKVAPIDCNVLLQGETGTGKELVAKSIHRLSKRKNKPFVSFNCGGFTDELICNELFGHEKGAYTGASLKKIGLLESAAKGTVFLDEIGEMPLSMQIKFLRVLQEKRILRVGGTEPVDLDIRIIAATNKDLKYACVNGTFREDLFFRLNVISFSLPTLCSRKEDIPVLVNFFIDKYNKAFGKNIKTISSECFDILVKYNFPGNVRELENIIQRAVVLADKDIIDVDDFPPDLQKLEFDTLAGGGIFTMEEMEKNHIEKILKMTKNNKGLASKILNIPRTTLWRKMKKFKLN